MTEKELRQKTADFLVPYIGIAEGSTKHKELIAMFNDSGLCTRYKMTTSDAWCAMSVSDAFIANDLTKIFPCVECSCANMISLAKTAGIWVEDDAYVPEIGDVIMYDWDDTTGSTKDNTGNPDHTGIVTKVSGSTIEVIEGNKNDTVGYRLVSVNGWYIRGFITPDYASMETREGWVQDGDLWWYQNADGSYPADEWKLINHHWYYFYANGFMAKGWQKLYGEWFYLEESGAYEGACWHESDKRNGALERWYVE